MQYKIGGCDVLFPHQAYGVQLGFMSKVIQALDGSHNALLEAPTGSGKTLSLLCASLAWQQREKLRIEEGLAAERLAARAAEEAGVGTTPGSGQYTSPAKGAEGPECKKQGQLGTPGQQQAAAASVGDGGFLLPGQGQSDGQEGITPGAAPRRKKPPRIFYATRTHSQIAQVVRELKRSNYQPKMAVLASRKQYCVNKFALGKPSVDEACEDLRVEGECKYHKNFMTLVTSGMGHRVHDIEDLCNYGRANKACPYFASRKMADDAELVFGPYSYLLDPVIRRAMQIDVADSVLVFDEAHNIEDVCREAASCEVEMTTMMEVAGAFAKAFAANGKPEVYGPLLEACNRILGWMQHKENEAVKDLARQRRPRPPSRQDPYEIVFMAQPLLDQLTAAGLGPDKVDTLWECYQAAREEDEMLAAGKGGAPPGGVGGNENAGGNGEAGAQGPGQAPATDAVRVGALALGVMSRLVQIVRMLHQVSSDGSRDYRLVVQRFEDQLSGPRFQGRSVRVAADDEEGGGRRNGNVVVNMCLWCLNPAVVFKEVSETAHSIILTSGTLAPLDSFASELGSPFHITLEAPHVVDMRKQVWAGIVTAAPGGGKLEGTYQHTNEDEYKDGVGRAVLECCSTIPDGVLLFVPSYGAMDKLAKRWRSTGLWRQLSRLKHIVMEPRGGGNDALQKVMEEYYGSIRREQGGLFIAVCRGKVSEGLDFADANARGVIIVGIPFPSVNDTKVKEKKVFNNRGVKTLGLLSGDAWYAQQAFRALNQAVGRCIRHRYDWGAIVLLDDRFRQPRHQAGLSRWVRGALVVHPSFDAGAASMQAFFQTLQSNPPQRPQQQQAQQQQQQAAATDEQLAAAAAAGVAASKAAAAAAAGLPAPQQLVPGGRVITQAQGRGAEGALGDWTTQHGAPAAPGHKPGFEQEPAGVPGVPSAWQSKPLAQARMGMPAAAAAGPAAAAAVSSHPQQHPQKQQHPEQYPQQQQQQQQWPAMGFGSGASGAAAQQTSLPPAQAAAQLVRRAPLVEWASLDVSLYMDFLAQRGVTPGQVGGACSMLELAAAAVQDAFAAAREFLEAGRSLAELVDEWQSSLPRGLQALVAASCSSPLPHFALVDQAAVAFGQQLLRGQPLPLLLEALSEAYAQALAEVVAQRGGPAAQQPYPAKQQQQQQGAAAATNLADLPTQPYQEVLFTGRTAVTPPSSAYQQHVQGQQPAQQHAQQPAQQWPGYHQQQQEQFVGSGGRSVGPGMQQGAQVHRGSKRNPDGDQQESRGKKHQGSAFDPAHGPGNASSSSGRQGQGQRLQQARGSALVAALHDPDEEDDFQ